MKNKGEERCQRLLLATRARSWNAKVSFALLWLLLLLQRGVCNAPRAGTNPKKGEEEKSSREVKHSVCLGSDSDNSFPKRRAKL